MSLAARGALYLDSARRMRPSQFAGRTRRLVPVSLLAAGTSSPQTPEWQPVAVGAGVDPAPQSGPVPPPDQDGVFTGPGASRRFGVPEFWSDPSDGLLFLFFLHGFSPLASYAAGNRNGEADRFWEGVVESWLAAESRPRLPSWHPYPTSLRLVAWSAALSAIDTWPIQLRSRVAREIARQARYLRRAVEYDIGGNHVLKNAAALVIAGAVTPASGVLEPGLRLLRRELSRQVLADGGHEERSTSYQRVVACDLKDVATVLDRAGCPVPSWLSEAIERMERWQAAIAGPDGKLPLLNDAWEGPGIGTPPHGDSVLDLADSGYVTLRSGSDQVIFDRGPISPPHLPPHAHADVLSFVFWADGHPFIVDPGAYAYTGEWRRHFRGTAAHNTVEVDGRDQCELWGDFRAAYPPRIQARALRRYGEITVAMASHDGYRRLADPVEHQRALIWCPGWGVVVVDRLLAARPHAVLSSLHMSPGTPVQGVDRSRGLDLSALGPGASVKRGEGFYAPYLGVKASTTVIRDRRTIAPNVPFGWSLLREGRHVSAFEIDRVVISADGHDDVTVPLTWG